MSQKYRKINLTLGATLIKPIKIFEKEKRRTNLTLRAIPQKRKSSAITFFQLKVIQFSKQMAKVCAVLEIILKTANNQSLYLGAKI